MVDKNDLKEALAHYGYALMQPSSFAEPEEVLRTLLKQDEARLLEGFPVVMANAMREKKLAWESSSWKPGAELSAGAASRLSVLMVVTQTLFRLFSLEKDLPERARRLAMKCAKNNTHFLETEEAFLDNRAVPLDGLELSAERLTKTFRNYVVHAPASKEALEKKQELELELLLSQLFTARQKELLKKRLVNKPMTKTEQEYFYRVVKKRLKALASEELHQMAKRLVA